VRPMNGPPGHRAVVLILALALAGCRSDNSEIPGEAIPIPGVLPAGTQIEIGLEQAISTATNHDGDLFTAILGIAVLSNGREALPAGTRVRGHVTTAHPKGPEGRAALGIALDSLEFRGKTVLLDAELIGGGAGLGAILKGPDGKAVDGKATGQIELPADTMFVFRLRQPAVLIQ
jgi:hypothetical protein